MVKKIKKYAKFVVCMALIMGLIAPSYAALSASDGSAFVTKAEFDSALADFNARLTTFEAGINSKIDSQVTSYLDRNGIWNGKEQYDVGPNADIKYLWLGQSFANGTEKFYKYNGEYDYSVPCPYGNTFAYDDTRTLTCDGCAPITLYGDSYTAGKITKWWSFDKLLISEVNKSGLMCLRHTLQPPAHWSGDNNQRFYWQLLSEKNDQTESKGTFPSGAWTYSATDAANWKTVCGRDVQDYGATNAAFFFDIEVVKNNSTTEKTLYASNKIQTVQFDAASVENKTTYLWTYRFTLNFGSEASYFFVSKGDKLYARMWAGVQPGSTGSSIVWNSVSKYAQNSQSGIAVWVWDSATVY